MKPDILWEVEFLSQERYVLPKKAVILVKCSKEWPAKSLWTMDYLMDMGKLDQPQLAGF